MKLTNPCLLGLSLLALAACRSSDPAPPPKAAPEPAEKTTDVVPPPADLLDEPELAEATVEAVPVAMPEVRYYEIADT